jgi:hypothetical protein
LLVTLESIVELEEQPVSDISKVVEFILQNQQDMVQRGCLPMWRIYEPTDFPGCYVARMFEVGGNEAPRPTEVMLRAVGPKDGLKTMRDAFEATGLLCTPRSAGDESELVESWMSELSRRPEADA